MTTSHCFGFDFPARIYIYERDPETFSDYEKRAPGYGYSMGYFIDEVYSRSMTACIYDRGRDDIPASTADPVVGEEFERSQFETFQATGDYDDVKVVEQGSAGVDTGPQFLFAVATYADLDSFEKQVGLVALTTWGGKFFKIRITQPRGGDATAEMKRVMEHWSEYLWATSDAPQITTPGFSRP